MSRVRKPGGKYMNTPHYDSSVYGPSKLERIHHEGEDYHKAATLSYWLFAKYDMSYKTFRNKSKNRRDELRKEFEEDTGRSIMDNENLPNKGNRPFFDSVTGTWKVAGDYGWEEGDALYIAGEFVKSGVCYPFYIERLEEEEYHNHEHSFEAVVEALLQTAHPECFSLKGFEEYYSEQEREFLMVVAGKLCEMQNESENKGQ